MPRYLRSQVKIVVDKDTKEVTIMNSDGTPIDVTPPVSAAPGAATDPFFDPYALVLPPAIGQVQGENVYFYVYKMYIYKNFSIKCIFYSNKFKMYVKYKC